VFLQVKLVLIRVWRLYQIFLVGFLAFCWIYDIVKLSTERTLAFVLLDPIFLGKFCRAPKMACSTEIFSFAGIEIYFMLVVSAFQSHLEIINEPAIIYHPVNEIDDEAYINDYY
jgi:hypothetical protein